MWASFRLLIEVQNALAPKLVRTVLNSWKSLKIYPTIFQTWKSLLKSIDHYLITLSLQKEIIVLGKSVEKVWNLVPKNLYKPCDDIKIDGTNVHDQIAFYAFHLCQACTTYIILQLGDEDYKFLLSPTIKYYFCFSKKDKCVISLNWCIYLPILSRCLSKEWRTLLSSFQLGIERWVFAVVVF